MTDQTCRVKLNRGVVASVHDGGIVILHVPSGRIYISNQTGARVWLHLQHQLPLQAIVAEISREYGIDQPTALKDTARFLAELERNGLTERGPE
jgi:hypothetical protein